MILKYKGVKVMWTCGVCNKTFNRKNYTHQCDIQAMDQIAQVTFHKWIPLYEKIESATKEQLGDFFRDSKREQYCMGK